MDFSLFLTIVIGAGTGTALVEAFIKLGLEYRLKDWLESNKIKRADKRECANNILELISSENYQKYSNPKDSIHDKAHHLSDRLITIGFKSESKILDKFVQRKRDVSNHINKLTSETEKEWTKTNYKEFGKHFLELSNEIDDLREQLLEVATKLKK